MRRRRRRARARPPPSPSSARRRRADPSGQPRVVKRCARERLRAARQTSAGPPAACTHSKPSLGCGFIGSDSDHVKHHRPRPRRDRHRPRSPARSSGTAIASCTASSPTAKSRTARGAGVPAIHFAGRFAAKEAAMKALGTGHSQGVLWRDVEVVRRGGPPQLQLHGGAARRFAAMGGRSSLLTITHSDDARAGAGPDPRRLSRNAAVVASRSRASSARPSPPRSARRLARLTADPRSRLQPHAIARRRRHPLDASCTPATSAAVASGSPERSVT